MCIRDSSLIVNTMAGPGGAVAVGPGTVPHIWTCLLYTSDAADDLTRVDLAGRRFVQAEDGIRDLVRSRGLGDVYKRQLFDSQHHGRARWCGSGRAGDGPSHLD